MSGYLPSVKIVITSQTISKSSFLVGGRGGRFREVVLSPSSLMELIKSRVTSVFEGFLEALTDVIEGLTEAVCKGGLTEILAGGFLLYKTSPSDDSPPSKVLILFLLLKVDCFHLTSSAMQQKK